MSIESVTERIPAWALCYIEYGDASGLQDSEVEMILDFYEAYRKGGMEIKHISPVVDENGNLEEYFSHSPAFGLPCSVVDCAVSYVIIPKEEKQ